MYLRTVLRSMPSCRAMADIVRPCRCRSRIIMSSPRVTTALLPPAKGSSIGGDGASPPHRKCPGRQAATTKLGKIRRPQLGRIQRPLTLAMVAGAAFGAAAVQTLHAKAKPPAYLISDVTITNESGYKEYADKFPGTLTAFGGKFLVRAGQTAAIPGAG